MTNPQPQPGYKPPTRAEPLQPDKPSSGDDKAKGIDEPKPRDHDDRPTPHKPG